MAEEELIQLNTRLDREHLENVEALAEHYGWSKREAVEIAIRTLSGVMAMHKEAAKNHDPDQRDLYAAVSREIPYFLIEVPKSVKLGRVGDQAVIRAPGETPGDPPWLLWRDEDSGHLVAKEDGGEERFGVITAGQIRPVVVPAEPAAT